MGAKGFLIMIRDAVTMSIVIFLVFAQFSELGWHWLFIEYNVYVQQVHVKLICSHGTDLVVLELFMV